MMQLPRATEDFVRHYRRLTRCTSDEPNSVGPALTRERELSSSIRELCALFVQFEDARRYSDFRFVAQAHRDFLAAFNDYRKRWMRESLLQLFAWELENLPDKKGVRQNFETLALSDVLIGQVLNPILWPNDSEADEPADGSDGFDPDWHSAADEFNEVRKTLDWDDWRPFLEAHDWFVKTVGINFEEIEKRWDELGSLVVVPQHVSNRHGLTEPRSLYAYLDNIRMAYVVGADLAALALCRTATEILIRFHYNNDDERTKLGNLIDKTVAKFDFLKPLNLDQKVREANQILHFSSVDIETASRARLIVREWAKDLQQVIAAAPTRALPIPSGKSGEVQRARDEEQG